MLIEGSQLGEAQQFHLLEMSRKGKIIGTKKKRKAMVARDGDTGERGLIAMSTGCVSGLIKYFLCTSLYLTVVMMATLC